MLNMGGISNYIIELGKFFKSNGFEVSVICTDRKGNWFDRIHQEGFQGKYFNSIFYEWMPFGRIIFARKIGRYMRKQAFDIIINNHSFYIHAAAGYLYDRTRIIHVIHNQLEKMVKREADPLSDIIVGVSPRIGELALRHLPAAKVTTILNGIPLPGRTDHEYNSCSERPKDILFVGRIDNRQKAVFMLPAIMSYLFDRGIMANITIVGEGEDLERLKQMTVNISHSGHFTFTGRVDPDQVSNYYNEHKILLLPSNFEGHPLTLMEAMAHGCVPVASLLPKCTDTCIEEGSSGYLVEVGKPGEFGERIAHLVSNEEELNQMSKNALKRAGDNFSNTISHRKYLELIETLKGEKLERSGFRLMNRKYMTWKEIVPFRLVLFVKQKMLKAN